MNKDLLKLIRSNMNSNTLSPNQDRNQFRLSKRFLPPWIWEDRFCFMMQHTNYPVSISVGKDSGRSTFLFNWWIIIWKSNIILNDWKSDHWEWRNVGGPTNYNRGDNRESFAKETQSNVNNANAWNPEQFKLMFGILFPNL